MFPARWKRTQFLSALINLCANSSHALLPLATHPELKIVVRELSKSDWKQESGRNYVTFASPEIHEHDGGFVVISVSDNGSGMTSQELQQACDPFFSTKSENNGLQFGGTGLGLSVVKGFLEQSNAGLDIFSEKEVGTTVRMIFPIANDKKTHVENKDAFPSASLDSIRVILVDDNELLLQSLQLTLETLGCSVTPFSSGTLAQQHLQTTENEYDILLTDIRMPNSIDGITLANWAGIHTPNLPVVLMTGFSEKHVSSKFPVIGKPFQRDRLQATLHAAIKQAESMNG